MKKFTLSSAIKSSKLMTSIKTVLALSGLVYSLSACGADEEFNTALSAANSGNLAQLEQFRWRMEADSLGYYPEYWVLNHKLVTQSPNSIIAFVEKHRHSAMAEKLAADYVEEKVRAGDYSAARAVAPYITNPDKSESCAIVQAQNRTGDDLSVMTRREVFWATDNDTKVNPELCKQLAQSMVSSALFSTTEKQARFWGLLRAGILGSAQSTGMTIGVPLSLVELNQIQNNPQNYLWSAPKNTATDHAYLIFALGRLASQDLMTALSMVDHVAQNTPEDVQKYLYRTVAYIGGTTVGKNNFNIEVLRNFQKSEGYFFSPEEAEIYARQSIRFSAWDSLISAIRQMSPNQQGEDRWQYWLARAYEQKGDKSTAKKMYKQLAHTSDDYHHLWAKARLNEAVHHQHNYQPSSSDMRRLAEDIHFKRAFALRRINAPESYTTREWNWAVRQAYLNHDDGLLLAAAKQALDMGWYDRAIYAAERTTKKHNYQYRYTMPYRDLVVISSQQANINPAWAYGIMRQESRFNANARSHVGATGLMQIMPNTGKLIARDLGESYQLDTLRSASGNIRYGTQYLSMLLRDAYNPVVVTAGYNAGPARAIRWQPNGTALEADQYTETIPFLETRDYVKHVMTNATHYSVMLGQHGVSIQQNMPTIAGR